MPPVFSGMMGVMTQPALVSVRMTAGLATGDFSAWMAAEQGRVNAICRRMLLDHDEADSAVQDTFFKAYQALQKGGDRTPGDPARWLTRIAVNTCLDRLRSRKWQFWRRQNWADAGNLVLATAASARPEGGEQYFALQIRARLEAALKRLSGRQRAVFILRHYEDLSLEEIARVLRLDAGTVKAHMFRAIAKLRVELRDLYGGVR
jgi:RNA polymerase sigma-70 factor (ECF subfamily)